MQSLFAADEDRDVGVVKREVAAQAEAGDLAEDVKLRSELRGFRWLTYEEVLSDPDNMDLSFRYAKQQVVQGNVLGATATLERILMLNPDLPRVRLFYAALLYRLDDLSEAERELQSLVDQEMPEDLRLQLEDYLDKIRLRRRFTRFSVRQNVGYQMDDNRNSAASSKVNLAGDVPVALTGTNKKRRDTSLISSTTISVNHDPGFQAGHEIFASGTYFLQEQTVADSLDLQSFAWSLGGIWKGGRVTITPAMDFSHTFVSREEFLRSQKGGVTVEGTVFNRLKVNAATSLERQDYRKTSESGSATERKGPAWKVSTGAQYFVLPNFRVAGTLSYTDKDAEEEFNGYKTFEMGVNTLVVLKEGHFLLNSVTSTFDFYDEVDTTVASRYRRDKGLRTRVTYGAPLKAFKLDKLRLDKFLPKMFHDVTVLMTYEYNRVLSTITNNTYRNNKYQVLVIKNWEF